MMSWRFRQASVMGASTQFSIYQFITCANVSRPRLISWLFTFFIICELQFTLHGQNQYELPHKRFEYKYSFKGPYLAQKDGTVPFWEYEGNAIASEEMVRITPSLRSKKGAIWTKQKTNFENWEVELVFRVTGRGRLGADGLAFWFTEQRMPEGPVFGAGDLWKGLGIFFDSFDNDGKGNNPYIMAMVNDGTKPYDHQNDGSTQQLNGCIRDFRNKPFPVRAKIEYYKNVLTVQFHSGNTQSDDDYEICFRVENLYLPPSGFYGVSAATGGLADDHDVLKFLTYSLHPPGQQPQGVGISDQEKEKFNKEYEAYKEKLQKQQEEYYKAHPDEAKKHHDMEEEVIDYGQRELNQIFQSQGHLFETIKQLHMKVDAVIGREERILGLLSTIQTGGGLPAAGQGAPVQGISPIQRHEVESILQSQRDALQVVREVKNHLLAIGSGGGGAAHAQGGSAAAAASYDPIIHEIRDQVNNVKHDLGKIGQRLSATPGQALPQGVGCPPAPACLGTGLFFLGVGIHCLLTIGYIIWKAKKDQKDKKFY